MVVSLCGEGACSRLSGQHSQQGGYAAQREQAPSPQRLALTCSPIRKQKSPDRKIRAFSCAASAFSYRPLAALNSRRRRCRTGSV
ncbi:hypothetical protein EJA72_23030 [Pseudomonas sp. PB120]|nr:hypothetical protein [Pseudomonas sp. PB120]